MRFCRICSDHILHRFLFTIALLCSAVFASAQQASYPILARADSAEVWFDRIVNPRYSAIMNGPEYHISFKGYKTHPFYQSQESDRSSVRYNNDLYTNVDLLYDIYGDILVLKSTTSTGSLFIRLDKNSVQSFDLYQHHFKKFIYNSNPTYFDVLYEENQFAVLVRRSKIERIDKRIRDYQENDIAYLLDNGKWIRITGSGSFAKTINKDQQKELKAFIKENHIKLQKRRDDDMKKLGAFCYSLKTK